VTARTCCKTVSSSARWWRAAGACPPDVVRGAPGHPEHGTDRRHRVAGHRPDSLRNAGVFYDLLGGAEDLDLHGLAAQRTLEFANLRVRLPQVAGRHHVFTGLDGRCCAGLRESFPGADNARRDVELTTELGQGLLARQNPLDRRPLELRAEDPPAVCLPPMLAHGASRRILRPHGEQSKRGALHFVPGARCSRTLRPSSVIPH
jgi:hypothetical protein